MKRFLFLALALLAGCGKTAEKSELPEFTLAISEYPSWSVFLVAKNAGLVGGREPSDLEKKWGVRLKVEAKDYEPCITMYGSGAVDATCMTNIDALNPALGRDSVVILPTSTSVGGDKVIAVGLPKTFNQAENASARLKRDLTGRKVYGLSKSVSEYVYVRGLQMRGLSPRDFPFVNLEPAAAATAIQSGSDEVKTVCVWNPFALQTLRSNKDAVVLFDSSLIPDEVIDCVVVGRDSLERTGGRQFAGLVCETFYKVCDMLNDPKLGDATHASLGKEFSNLSASDMRICCKETKFYDSPQKGVALFRDETFRKKTMPTVVSVSKSIGVLTDKTPTVGFSDHPSQLHFSDEFMSQLIK